MATSAGLEAKARGNFMEVFRDIPASLEMLPEEESLVKTCKQAAKESKHVAKRSSML